MPIPPRVKALCQVLVAMVTSPPHPALQNQAKIKHVDYLIVFYSQDDSGLHCPQITQLLPGARGLGSGAGEVTITAYEIKKIYFNESDCEQWCLIEGFHTYEPKPSFVAIFCASV